MTRRMQIVTGVTLLLASSGLALGTGKDPGLAGPFGVALVHLEQNVTDGDSEVVFEVKAGRRDWRSWPWWLPTGAPSSTSPRPMPPRWGSGSSVLRLRSRGI